MRELGMKGAELRTIGGKNIMDLSDAEIAQTMEVLDRNGLQVICIASPLLKCTLPDAPEIDSRFQQDSFNAKHRSQISRGWPNARSRSRSSPARRS